MLSTRSNSFGRILVPISTCFDMSTSIIFYFVNQLSYVLVLMQLVRTYLKYVYSIMKHNSSYSFRQMNNSFRQIIGVPANQLQALLLDLMDNSFRQNFQWSIKPTSTSSFWERYLPQCQVQNLIKWMIYIKITSCLFGIDWKWYFKGR